MSRARLLLPILLLAASYRLGAQTTLSITDVLFPYRLTATLLANGHFSISTMYTGTGKTLVYQEDGSGNKPVNYTSHIHFKVDDVIFQLPYELNPATRLSPPDHPLKVTRLFRDTTAGAPRINAEMFGTMPDGDTIRFLFTMQPVQRPSGGFIRMSAEVRNTTSRARSVGVLMLIDTKIGDNDQAPIISSFGYRTVETEFDAKAAPGMPEFWLGLEGTPVAPGLTARGNLRADGLITPDYFLFGNWKDNTAVAGATGLDLALWRERRAFNAGYTDSAILLLWEEQGMAPGESRLRASTEIGIVDSIGVSFGSGGFGGIAFGGAGLGGNGGAGGGCLGFDTVRQRVCGDPAYHPYLPDSLQTLYLVTNTGGRTIPNVRVVVPALPPGLTVATPSSDVIPGTLAADVTGVGTLTFHALPRINAKTYSVPIALVADPADTLIRDTLCITVAGLAGSISVDSLIFPPVCPGLDDTLSLRVRLTGPRCLDLAPRALLEGPAPDIGRFAIIDPAPAQVPANGTADIPVRYQAGLAGQTHRTTIVVMATERGLNDDDRDTTIILSDTAVIRGISRDAEFLFAGPTDTLDLGGVCLGDTVVRDWLITNIGGCELTIGNDYTFLNDPLRQFAVANEASFPLAVARGSDERALISFAPQGIGTSEARLIIRSAAAPFADTLIVRGRGEAPSFRLIDPPAGADTVCPGDRFSRAIPIENPTSCPVTITGLSSSDSLFRLDTGGFVLPPRSRRQIVVTSRVDTPGTYSTLVTIRSAGAGDSVVTLRTVVASRALAYGTGAPFGDVRLGTTAAPQRLAIGSTGTADVVITGLRIAGGNASEYAYTLPNGETFPVRLAPGATLALDLGFTPADLEERRAAIIIETAPGTLCDAAPAIELTGRGVQPVIDAPRRRFELGRLCAGRALDTVIVIRNVGNAPMNVGRVDVERLAGRMRVEATGLPAVIQPDSSAPIAVKLEPESLGPIDIALHFVSDGPWFTAPDTTVRLGATGVLCGIIWADTVHGAIGDQIAIPIHLDASPLSPTDVARLMNESNARSISLTLSGDPKLIRFDAGAPAGGMLAALPTPPAVAATGARVHIASDDANGALSPSDLVAVLKTDLLLGDKDRSPIALSVESFAGGNADLSVGDGMVLAEYCAIDRRYVRVSGPVLAPEMTPVLKEGGMIMHLPEASRATVTLYDPLGRPIAVLHDGQTGSGTYRLRLPADIPAGIYTARLSTDHGSATTRVIIIE